MQGAKNFSSGISASKTYFSTEFHLVTTVSTIGILNLRILETDIPSEASLFISNF